MANWILSLTSVDLSKARLIAEHSLKFCCKLPTISPLITEIRLSIVCLAVGIWSINFCYVLFSGSKNRNNLCYILLNKLSLCVRLLCFCNFKSQNEASLSYQICFFCKH